MKRIVFFLPLLAAMALAIPAGAQLPKAGRIGLTGDSSNYLRFTLMTQVWVRQTQLNPGSTIHGTAKDAYTDIGIRRARAQVFGQIADRVFIYSQFGMNNFNYTSDRKAGFFIHDILGEYEVVRRKLSLGAGLTGWSGLVRYSSPSAGTIMGIDAPLFEQNTNDVTDQFLRKLSVYAKGKLNKFDYRLVMSSPMAVQKSNNYSAAVGENASFSALPPSMQWNGYFQYQIFDEESNLTPYTTGTYLGAKKVFNIGAGFQYQPGAMWRRGAAGDTVTSPLKNFAVDVYYDAPVAKNGSSLHLYAAYLSSDFGKGYLRNLGPMNPATGNSDASILNGGGNNYPAFGTGNIFYGQLGYKFANNAVGKSTFMPYVSVQYADYDRLQDKMLYWDGGVNWLLSGHTSKLTLAYQSHPVYQVTTGNAKAVKIDRKGALILQYQVFLN
jgi:hypothetical protein